MSHGVGEGKEKRTALTRVNGNEPPVRKVVHRAVYPHRVYDVPVQKFVCGRESKGPRREAGDLNTQTPVPGQHRPLEGGVNVGRERDPHRERSRG